MDDSYSFISGDSSFDAYTNLTYSPEANKTYLPYASNIAVFDHESDSLDSSIDVTGIPYHIALQQSSSRLYYAAYGISGTNFYQVTTSGGNNSLVASLDEYILDMDIRGDNLYFTTEEGALKKMDLDDNTITDIVSSDLVSDYSDLLVDDTYAYIGAETEEGIATKVTLSDGTISVYDSTTNIYYIFAFMKDETTGDFYDVSSDTGDLRKNSTIYSSIDASYFNDGVIIE